MLATPGAKAGGGERELPAGNGRVLQRSVIIIIFSLAVVEVRLKVIALGNIYILLFHLFKTFQTFSQQAAGVHTVRLVKRVTALLMTPRFELGLVRPSEPLKQRLNNQSITSELHTLMREGWWTYERWNV